MRPFPVNNVQVFWNEYDIKDHLGNVRMTITPDDNNVASIIQEDSYYPFGLKLPGQSSVSGTENKYTYNGKELVDDFDLNWYHYGARYYDPTLGRWHSIDPADEFHSPYVYCANNPINASDKDGRWTYFIHGTWSDNSTWQGRSVQKWSNMLVEQKGHTRKLEWNGSNSKTRDLSARLIANDIMINYQTSGDKTINLVAHSHGGNMAIAITNWLHKDNGIQVDNLILIGTPVSDDYQLDTGVTGKFINISNKNDLVQLLGGDFKREQPNAVNIDVTNLIDETGPIESHSAMHNNDDVISAAGEALK